MGVDWVVIVDDARGGSKVVCSCLLVYVAVADARYTIYHGRVGGGGRAAEVVELQVFWWLPCTCGVLMHVHADA